MFVYERQWQHWLFLLFLRTLCYSFEHCTVSFQRWWLHFSEIHFGSCIEKLTVPERHRVIEAELKLVAFVTWVYKEITVTMLYLDWLMFALLLCFMHYDFVVHMLDGS